MKARRKKTREKLPSCFDAKFVYVKAIHSDISLTFARIIEERRLAQMAHETAQAERDVKVTDIGRKVAKK